MVDVAHHGGASADLGGQPVAIVVVGQSPVPHHR